MSKVQSSLQALGINCFSAQDRLDAYIVALWISIQAGSTASCGDSLVGKKEICTVMDSISEAEVKKFSSESVIEKCQKNRAEAEKFLIALQKSGLLEDSTAFIRNFDPCMIVDMCAYEKYMKKKSVQEQYQVLVLISFILKNTRDCVGAPEILDVDPREFYDKYVVPADLKINYADFFIVWKSVHYKKFQISHPVASEAMQTAANGLALPKKEFDDSRLECTIFLDRLTQAITKAEKVKSVLLVNPSPYFLRDFISLKKKNEALRRAYIGAIIDDPVEREAYRKNTSFKGTHFFGPDNAYKPADGYRIVAIISGDKQIHAGSSHQKRRVESLYNFFGAVSEEGEVLLLLPQGCISNQEENKRFFRCIKSAGLMIDTVVDVPNVLSESAPRSKMLLHAQAGSNHKLQYVNLLSVTCRQDDNEIAVLYRKVVYQMSLEELQVPQTLKKKAKMIFAGDGTSEKEQTVRYEHRYDFSKEIHYFYLVQKNHARSPWTAQIQVRNVESKRSCYEKPLSVYIKKLAEEPSAELIRSIAEDAAYDPNIMEAIRSQLEAHTAADSHLSFKTIWYYLYGYLIVHPSYRATEAKWRAIMGGQSIAEQNLQRFILDEDTPERFAECAVEVLGDPTSNSILWSQLNRIVNLAEEGALIERNPFRRVGEIRKAARTGYSTVKKGLTNPAFLPEEESRMRQYLEEPVCVDGKVWSKAATDSKMVVGALVWLAHLDPGEALSLIWSDFHLIADSETIGSFYCLEVRGCIGADGSKTSNANRRGGNAWRTIALHPFLTRILLERKRFLMTRWHFTEEELSSRPIIVKKELQSTGKQGRVSHKQSPASHSDAIASCRNLGAAAQKSSNLIPLTGASQNPREIDLNATTAVRILHSDFEYNAITNAHFSDGEIAAYLGRETSIVYYRNYCDFTWTPLLCATALKLVQWNLEEPEAEALKLVRGRASRISAACKKKKYTHTMPYPRRYASDLLITASSKAKGVIQISTGCGTGIKGYISKVEKKGKI